MLVSGVVPDVPMEQVVTSCMNLFRCYCVIVIAQVTTLPFKIEIGMMNLVITVSCFVSWCSFSEVWFYPRQNFL